MRDWRRFLAPAAFLLAATVAVVLIHSGVEAGGSGTATPTVPPAPHRRVAVETTATTAATKQHPASTSTTGASQYWTVAAGDSFGVISSKSGVPVATIEQLNPGVSSTSLVIGQKVRIR